MVIGGIYSLSNHRLTNNAEGLVETRINLVANQTNSQSVYPDEAQSIPAEVAEIEVSAPDAVYLFPTNKSEIIENEELNKIAKLAIESEADVAIVAYTDESGSQEYNQRLSERRAKSIGDYLISHGVDASHISTTGKGETHRFPTNAQDRRAEIRLMV